ncbi:MAG: hypothetical protein LUH50_10195 [Bacteroides intestinalis]|nr:hypothetical protein [Bacteroides intestinalis]
MNFKSIFTILIALSILGVMFVMAGCVREELVSMRSASENGQVHITVNIPGQQLPSTRSIDGNGGESAVSDIYILVFEKGAGSNEVLAEKVKGEIVSQSVEPDGSYKVEFEALLQVNANAKTLAVVANAEDAVTALTAGAAADTKSSAYGKLIYASQNSSNTPEGWKWKANNGKTSDGNAVAGTDYTPIPMHGEHTLPTGGVKEGLTINDMKLMRMLARIDVVNNAAGFTLKKVYLTNYNTRGMICRGGSAGGTPVLNIPANPGAQKGETNAMGYDYPTTGGTLEGEIYTYEAVATDGKEGAAGHTDATCLVVEGEIGGKTYFYRIDFTATTDAKGREPNDVEFDPATVGYMPVYRNHRYTFDITEVEAAGYNDFEDALKSLGMRNNMKVSLLVVDESEIKDIVFNGKHFLGIGDEGMLEASSGDIAEIACITNYAYGWQVDTSKGANGIEYTKGTGGWLQAEKDGQEKDKKANLKLTAKTDNNEGDERKATVYLKAGTLLHEVEVTQRDLLLKIVDDSDNEITELLFCEAINMSETSPPPAQNFTVKWAPKNKTVSITNTIQGKEFPSGGATGVPGNGSVPNDGTGAHTYTIKPTALTAEELKQNPFIEKESLLNFTVNSGSSGRSESRQILLRQMMYNLVVDETTNYYRLDGSTYTIRVRSNADWKINAVRESTGTGTLLNLAQGDNLRVNTTGKANTETGTAINFTVENNITNLNGTVTVEFVSTEGLFGMVTVTLNLSGEYYPTPHKGWAGSNIYWNGSKLTFDDVGDQSHKNYQGVYFQWGGLTGIAPNGAYGSIWETSILVYKPGGNAGVVGGTWNSWPRVNDATITSNPPMGKTVRDRAYLYEMTDESAGIGDICKYLTDKAGGTIYGKKWRMPTSQEFETAANYTRSGTFSYVTSNDATGKFVNSNAPGYTKSTDVGTLFFPASGYRYSSNGQLYYVGYYGYYWSGSPSGAYGCSLYFDSGNVYPASGSNRSYGFAVRCVAE